MGETDEISLRDFIDHTVVYQNRMLDEVRNELLRVERQMNELMDVHRQAHHEGHILQDRAQAKFEALVQESLAEVRRNTDILRVEHSNLVSREIFDGAMQMNRSARDAEITALHEKVDRLERQVRERIDGIREDISSDIEDVEERLQRDENAMAAMTARLQQSILFLGILTAVVQLVFEMFRR